MQSDKRRRYLSFFGSRPEVDVEDEIAFHLEMRARELVQRGMNPAEAREEARRRFGDRARVEAEMRRMEREKSRRSARLAALRDWRGDLRFVVRALVRQPVFSLAAILTLGLSIGVNAAIFSAVNAFLLKPLPVAGADRQVVVAVGSKKEDVVGNVAFPVYRDVKDLPVFEDAVSWLGWEVAVRSGTNVQRGFVLAGSDNYLTGLGIQARLGRVYTEADAASRSPVVVLTDDFWQREFAGDPGVLGRTMHLNDAPFTIIGVLPKAFIGTQPLVRPDILMPAVSMVSFYPDIEKHVNDRSYGAWRILARLKPGVSVEQARLAVDALSHRYDRDFPREFRDARLVMAREQRARPDLMVSSIVPWIAAVFFGMVGLAVLVACANVANLLLARATARRSEIAVRAALGAERSRVIRLLLTESVLLGAASLVVAYGLARFSITWLANLPIAIDVPITLGLELDWRVFTYAAAVSVLAGVVAGLAPAVLGSRAPVADVLREAGRSGSGGAGRTRFRNTLVVAQVAVSFVLLVCGGLFMRGARQAAQLDLGFSRDRVLLANIDLSLHRMDSATARRVQDTFLERSAALPNVEAVGLGTHLPLGGNSNGRDLYLDSRPTAAPEGVFHAWYANVSPGYLNAMGFRLRSGRHFSDDDDADAPGVAIVNRAAAEAMWPGENAIGRRFRLSEDGPHVEVVGLIDNAQYLLLGEQSRPFAYFPLRQMPGPQTFIVTRTRSRDPLAAAADIRGVLRDMDPNILVSGVRSMANHLDNGIALFFINIGATLATAIGLLGLLQTVVGLYGVLSYTVAQRTREFGIRQALGASTSAIIGGVLRQGSVLCGIGLAIGGVLALALTRLLASMLYGVSPTDAMTFGGALLVVSSVALVSSYLPAWRASRVAPATAIRRE